MPVTLQSHAWMSVPVDGMVGWPETTGLVCLWSLPQIFACVLILISSGCCIGRKLCQGSTKNCCFKPHKILVNSRGINCLSRRGRETGKCKCRNDVRQKWLSSQDDQEKVLKRCVDVCCARV